MSIKHEADLSDLSVAQIQSTYCRDQLAVIYPHREGSGRDQVPWDQNRSKDHLACSFTDWPCLISDRCTFKMKSSYPFPFNFSISDIRLSIPPDVHMNHATERSEQLTQMVFLGFFRNIAHELA